MIDESLPWDHDEFPLREPGPEGNWCVHAFEGDISGVLCAQSTFSEFARVAELERHRIVPVYEAIAVKAFFPWPDEPTDGEHMFLTEVTTDGQQITATLNADSTYDASLKEGQEVTFHIDRLSDWFLVRKGRGLGGFTMSHIWHMLSDEEKEQYQSSPPFSWFAPMDSYSPFAAITDLQKCTKCGRRDFHATGDAKPVCGLCEAGFRRCQCTNCNAPLLRRESLPEVCVRCG